MAFAQHRPPKPRVQRDDRDHDFVVAGAGAASHGSASTASRLITSPTTTTATTSDHPAGDWSLVFPGRQRSALPEASNARSSISTSSNLSASKQSLSPSLDPFSSPSASPTLSALPSSSHDFTLPPLHDGTGRFASTSSAGSVSAGETSARSSDDLPLSTLSLPPRSAHSLTFSGESVSDRLSDLSQDTDDLFDDSGAEADQGYGPDSEREDHRSRDPPTPRRRRSRRSLHTDSLRDSSWTDAFASTSAGGTSPSVAHFPSSQRDGQIRSPALSDVSNAPPHSIGNWSWLASHLGSQQRRQVAATGSEADVIFTSDSEGDAGDDSARPAPSADLAFEHALAHAPQAHSAGLVFGERHPKRRHRKNAAGRSSKRSNTSLSGMGSSQQPRATLSEQAGVRRERRPRRTASSHDGKRESQRGAPYTIPPHHLTSATHMDHKNHSVRTKILSTLLRKVFSLEPEVLDAFLTPHAGSSGGAVSPPLTTSHGDLRTTTTRTRHSRPRRIALGVPSGEQAASSAYVYDYADSRHRAARSVEREGNSNNRLARRGVARQRLHEVTDVDEGDETETERLRQRDRSAPPSAILALAYAVSEEVQSGGAASPAQSSATSSETDERVSKHPVVSTPSTPRRSLAPGPNAMDPSALDALTDALNGVGMGVSLRLWGVLARTLGWGWAGWNPASSSSSFSAARAESPTSASKRTSRTAAGEGILAGLGNAADDSERERESSKERREREERDVRAWARARAEDRRLKAAVRAQREGQSGGGGRSESTTASPSVSTSTSTTPAPSVGSAFAPSRSPTAWGGDQHPALAVSSRSSSISSAATQG